MIGFGQIIYGCLDSSACNYDMLANTDDGSCVYPTTSNTTVTACDSYLWNDSTYNTSGIYFLTSYDSIYSYTTTDTVLFDQYSADMTGSFDFHSSPTSFGEQYLLQVTGTYSVQGLPNQLDGAYCFGGIACPNLYQCMHWGLNITPTSFSAIPCNTNPLAITSYPQYNPNHEYWISLEGTGSPFRLSFLDVNYNDNTGSLIFKIYQLNSTQVTNTAQTNLQNVNGCDSTVILDLTIAVCGCTDSVANNYNPLATLDDSSCTYTPVHNITQGNDYTTIQLGIDGANSGDTLIVDAGTYYENINFNGMNIVLASHFLLTLDSAYIDSTIIDGNNNGSVVTFNNGEDSTAILSGFTITNGLAQKGGGVYISSNIKITNCIYPTTRCRITSHFNSTSSTSLYLR